MTRRQIDLPDEHAEVFIAHLNQSLANEVAQALLKLLTERGLSCFLDTRDLSTGVSYIRPILTSIRQARVVVVLFCPAPSPWVLFEAGCAFSDEKLMPVSIGGTVPAPYDRIQLERVVSRPCTPDATPLIDLAALGRVADEIKHRVHGRPADTAATLRWRHCNALFFSGLPILAGLVFALLMLRGDSLLTQHLRHLHVVLGAAVVGGQFFLALAFARVMASPSFRQREFGFDTIERLFGVWFVLALLQPALGLWFGLRVHQHQVLPHVWCALALYLAALLLSLGGYVAAGSARQRDAAHDAPRRVAARHLQANLLFLAGFAVMAAVVNLMLTRQLPWAPPAPPAPALHRALPPADEAAAISAALPGR